MKVSLFGAFVRVDAKGITTHYETVSEWKERDRPSMNTLSNWMQIYYGEELRRQLREDALSGFSMMYLHTRPQSNDVFTIPLPPNRYLKGIRV